MPLKNFVNSCIVAMDGVVVLNISGAIVTTTSSKDLPPLTSGGRETSLLGFARIRAFRTGIIALVISILCRRSVDSGVEGHASSYSE